jgi:hypothetical protein
MRIALEFWKNKMGKKFKKLLGKIVAIGSLVSSLYLFPVCASESCDFLEGASADLSIRSGYMAENLGFKSNSGATFEGYFEEYTPFGNFYQWVNFAFAEHNVNEVDFGWDSPSLKLKGLEANFALDGYIYPDSSGFNESEIGPRLSLSSPSFFNKTKLKASVNFDREDFLQIYKISLAKKFKMDPYSFSVRTYVVSQSYPQENGISHAIFDFNLSRKSKGGIEYYLSFSAKEIFEPRSVDNVVGFGIRKYLEK